MSGSVVAVTGLAAVLAGTSGVAGAAARAPKGLTSSVTTKGSAVVGKATTLVPGAHLVAHDKVVSYSLSFGDGSRKATGKALPKSVSHTFHKAGAFSVVLTVKDKLGHQAKTTHVVHVITPAAGGAVVVTAPVPRVPPTTVPASGAPTIVGPTGPTFGTAVPIPTTYTAVDTVVADLNGDGYPDVVLVADKSPSPSSAQFLIQILLNDGHGGFVPAPGSADLDVPGSILRVAVADMNGDGVPDLVVSEDVEFGPPTENAVGVYLGDGLGRFSTDAKLTRAGGTADVVTSGGELPGSSVVAQDSAGNFSVLRVSGGSLVSSPLTTAQDLQDPVMDGGSLLGYAPNSVVPQALRFDPDGHGGFTSPVHIPLPDQPQAPLVVPDFLIDGVETLLLPTTTAAGAGAVDVISDAGELISRSAIPGYPGGFVTMPPSRTETDGGLIRVDGQQFAFTDSGGLIEKALATVDPIVGVVDADLDGLPDLLVADAVRTAAFPGDRSVDGLGVAHQVVPAS